uniref:Uncharacterized protein n=1 Tax=Anopheles culicifacies TaxID=139723 RepID=A0A182M4E8_9DIPT
MFSNPFSATVTILGSITVSSSHMGGMQPISTCKTIQRKTLISMMLGKMLASIAAWIWFRLPAAMFEIVQHASFRTASFVELSSCRIEGKALQFRISCVWVSLPVTMLPTARNAAETTLLWLCLQ